jgi:hypothetical protein
VTTIADIVKAFKALWDGDGTLSGIPLCHGRVETAPDAPYATVTVSAGPKQYNSGVVSIEDFLVDVRVYGNNLVQNAGDYQSAMGTVYDTTSNISGIDGFMSIFRDQDNISEDVARKNATDVVVAQGTWTITIQNNRGS